MPTNAESPFYFFIFVLQAIPKLTQNWTFLDTGRVWVDYLTCGGEEKRLADCRLSWGTGQCSHSNDVIVWCDATSNSTLAPHILLCLCIRCMPHT